MPPAMIQLPCRLHRQCLYHKYWDNPAESSEVSATPKNSTAINTRAPDSIESKRASILYNRFSPYQTAAQIQCFPTEILLSILAYLPSVEQASLALTCRSFAHALGPEVWRHASKAGQASWYKHACMLDLLQRDLDSNELWRCRECLRFHLRSKPAPKDDPKRLWGLDSRLKAVLNFGQRDEKQIRIGPRNDPLFVVDFNLLKAVMDRHLLGAPDGACLNSLNCQGVRKFPSNETVDIALKYEFVPKIVLDKLLLRCTYTFSSHRRMFIRNVKIEDVTAQDFLKGFDFPICNHEQAGGIAQPFQEEKEGGRLRKVGRCNYCPTQYAVDSLPHMGLRIVVWQNLGSARSPKDPKWSHLSRTGKEIKVYAWGLENLDEAFERILCSTKDEFQRQLENSDGGGSWYDPELKKRAYRTLPSKLVDRL